MTAGEFGSWTFIGAEQIAGGVYDVALHLPGSDQSTVWGTDGSGNVISNATGGIVSGTSTALESLEPIFHQDLNGDGTIGIAPIIISAYGSTALAQVGSNYFLNPVGGGDGAGTQIWRHTGDRRRVRSLDVYWRRAGHRRL